MRKPYVLLLPLIALTALSTGCANFNSVFREFDADAGKSVMVDIKQRAIIASRQTEGGKTSTIICAEPSPDALSAYAAELAAEGKLPEQTAVQLTAAFQESASFVGLRTQSIQLLRDSLYRLCEGYMSGALQKSQYDILMRRYQKYMVALLGIEQLTGTVRAPTVTISSQGAATAAQSISALRSEVESIDTKITALEEKKTANGTSDADKTQIGKDIDALKADRNAVTQAIANAHGLSSSGSMTATVHLYGQPTQRSDAHIQAVAGAVQDIVGKIITTDDTGQLCFSYLSSGSPAGPLVDICKKHFEAALLRGDLMLKIEQSLAAGGNTKEKTAELKEALKRLRESGLGTLSVVPFDR